MAKKQKQLSPDKKKFSLGEFVWLGFNYTVGISFIGACAGLSNMQGVNSDGIKGIGMNILWVYIIEGLIAGVCAWAFARIARAYKSSNNGGAYIYARGTFNKFVGLFITFMLYVGMPFMITFQILMLIRGTFSPSYVWIPSSDPSAGIPWYGFQWGPFGDLYLDLIGIGIYMASAIIIFFGVRMYKKFAHITAGVKWGAALFLIIAAIALACMQGAGSQNLKEWADYSGSKEALHMDSIISSFNSCFYFFAGFEIFSTAGQNVKNPQKNIGLGVTLIMIISTIFYVLILLLFFAALPISEGFQQNETMSLWGKFSSTPVVLYGGPILLIISSVALKINAAMQNSLYGGTMLQPMAVEGYFPDSWGKLDKDGLPAKASKINLFVVALFVVVWLAIPDLVKGIQNTADYKTILAGPNDIVSGWGKEAAEQWLAQVKSAFTVRSLTAASSTITISVYIVVLLCASVMGARKQITLKLWELIAFPIAFIVMVFLFIYHYYEVSSSIYDYFHPAADFTPNSSQLVGSIVELAFVICAILFFIIWYFTYYGKKFTTRLRTNPSLQKQLDAEFIPIDDWSFTAIAISNILKNKPYKGRDKAIKLLNEYLTRNEAINKNTNNQSYREAARIKLVLLKGASPLITSLDKVAKRFDETNAKHKIFNEIQIAELINDPLTS